MVSELVERVRRALFGKGFLVGEVDGIWGRRTIAALKDFQEASGLAVDGIFGPRTARKLFPSNGDAPVEPLLPWVAEAESLKGTSEIAGKASNTTLLQFGKDLGIDYSSDEIAWCGLFVGHCIGATLPEEVLPTNLLRARSWARFGESTAPRSGAIMVFSRGSPESGQGHVGFYVGETPDSYLILGGNQSNTVSVASSPKSRFLVARWPRTADSLSGGQPIVPIEIGHDGTLMWQKPAAPGIHAA